MYLLNSSSLIRCNKSSGHCVPQSSISISNSWPYYLYHLQYAHFMISDLAYTRRDFYASNKLRFRPTCLLSGLSATSLHIRGFYYLVNTLTNEVNICTREKSLLHSAKFLLLPPPRILKSDTPHNSTSEQVGRRLTTWIINSSISVNTPLYIRTSEKAIYYKLMMLLILCRLIEKVDYKGRFKILIKKVD